MTTLCEYGHESFCESPNQVEAQIPKDANIKELPNTGDGIFIMSGIGLMCIIIGYSLARKAKRWVM